MKNTTWNDMSGGQHIEFLDASEIAEISGAGIGSSLKKAAKWVKSKVSIKVSVGC